MLTTTAVYKKYAGIIDYEEFVSATLAELRGKFPQASLQSFADFKSFLDGLIPRLVHKYLLLSRSMKECSNLAPDFAEIASAAGFVVLVQRTPGHFRNIVLTVDGPFIVDLTYVQFMCNQDDKSEKMNMFRELYRNPFAAMKLEEHPKEWIAGCGIAHGEYSSVSPDPTQSINDYSVEETEELFPERFKAYKDVFI